MTPENEIFPVDALDPTVSSESCWISKAAHLVGKIIVKTVLPISENQLRGSNETVCMKVLLNSTELINITNTK